MSIEDKKGGGTQKGGQEPKHSICVKERWNWTIFINFEACAALEIHSCPPLLPPLFKFNKFVKYDTLGSFCTKNQVCIIRRSWDQVISILVRSWKNQRFFPTSRLRFCPPFCESPAVMGPELIRNPVSWPKSLPKPQTRLPPNIALNSKNLRFSKSGLSPQEKPR